MSDYYYYYYYSFLFLIALLLPPLPIYGGECRLPKLAMVILATRLSFPSSSSLLLSLLSSLSSLLLSFLIFSSSLFSHLLFFSPCKTVIDYAVFA